MSKRRGFGRQKTADGATRQEQGDPTLVDLTEVGEQAQSFIEKNQTALIGGLAAILLVVGGYFAYKHLYQIPKTNEAIEMMAQAQMQFERDSFAAALENPGLNSIGFLDIISDYSGTPSANSAKYYAGLCYLNLGRFEDAIDYLKKYSASDLVTSITKHGALGDAYSELGDTDKAITSYKKAIAAKANEFLTPYYMKKLALLQFDQGNKDDAAKIIARIKSDFPFSSEGIDADKMLAMMK